MIKRFAMLLAGTATLTTALGCCCHRNRCSPCATGNCPPAYGAPAYGAPAYGTPTYTVPGAYNQGYGPQSAMILGTPQTAMVVSPSDAVAIQTSPIIAAPATAMGPKESLPTY